MLAAESLRGRFIGGTCVDFMRRYRRPHLGRLDLHVDPPLGGRMELGGRGFHVWAFRIRSVARIRIPRPYVDPRFPKHLRAQAEKCWVPQPAYDGDCAARTESRPPMAIGSEVQQ